MSRAASTAADRERGPGRRAEHRAEGRGELDVARAQRGGTQRGAPTCVADDGHERRRAAPRRRTGAQRQERQRSERRAGAVRASGSLRCRRSTTPGRDPQPAEAEQHGQPRRRQRARAPQPPVAAHSAPIASSHTGAAPGRLAAARPSSRRAAAPATDPAAPPTTVRARTAHRASPSSMPPRWRRGGGGHGRRGSVDGARRWGQLPAADLGRAAAMSPRE